MLARMNPLGLRDAAIDAPGKVVGLRKGEWIDVTDA
jgi:hypothetical protein